MVLVRHPVVLVGHVSLTAPSLKVNRVRQSKTGQALLVRSQLGCDLLGTLRGLWPLHLMWRLQALVAISHSGLLQF